jgi:uncharacterized protein (TIGR03084 family)
MAISMTDLLSDLSAETDDLLVLLDANDIADWDRPTPAAGWDVRDQVSHLAFFDDAATLALTDPEHFRDEAAALMAGGMDFPDRIAGEHHDRSGAELLVWFRSSRAALLDAFGGGDPRRRLPWFGPEMSAASCVTARLMETWAHGHDIADALVVRREPTNRLRHVADLGVRTRGFSYAVHGLPAPQAPVHVDLDAPDGSAWTWGDPGAADRVTGTAEDFCLVVCQRRPVAETGRRHLRRLRPCVLHPQGGGPGVDSGAVAGAREARLHRHQHPRGVRRWRCRTRGADDRV